MNTKTEAAQRGFTAVALLGALVVLAVFAALGVEIYQAVQPVLEALRSQS